MGTIYAGGMHEIGGDAYGPYRVVAGAWGTMIPHGPYVYQPGQYQEWRPLVIDKLALRERIIDRAEDMYARGDLTIEQLEKVTELALREGT